MDSCTNLIYHIFWNLFSYTNNIKLRLEKHNSNKGAKATKGCNWEIIFKKKFQDKRKAMSYEYKLKKDRKQRSFILKRNLNI